MSEPIRGQRDHGHGADRRPRAEGADERVAVIPGHHEVADDDVWSHVVERGKRPPAGGRGQHLGPAVLEDGVQEVAGVFIVVHDEDLDPLEQARVE